MSMVRASSQYSICPQCHSAVPEKHPTLLHWRKCQVCAYSYQEERTNAAQEGKEQPSGGNEYWHAHGRGVQPSPSNRNRVKQGGKVQAKDQEGQEKGKVMDHHSGPKRLKDSQMICDECGIVSNIHATGICSDCRKRPCAFCGKGTTSKLKEPTCRDCQVLSPAKRAELQTKTAQRRKRRQD